MILTHKVRIFPSPEQEELLWALSERCRLLYNFALTERKVIWQQEKQKPTKERELITYQDQQNALLQSKRDHCKLFSKQWYVYNKSL